MRSLISRAVVIQNALVVVALAAVSLIPPARGPVLLVPLGANQAAAIRIATERGARLLGSGPGGGVFVWAAPGMVAPLVAAGVLPLAAPFSACGAVAA